jgi:hypothetical protein
MNRSMEDPRFTERRTTGSMPDAVPNGGNQSRTTIHCTNVTVACTTLTGSQVPWRADEDAVSRGSFDATVQLWPQD